MFIVTLFKTLSTADKPKHRSVGNRNKIWNIQLNKI